MKVSQHITAGSLTNHWIGYDGRIQLTFGSDEISFDLPENQLRSLLQRLTERVQEIEDKRAVELADAIAEKEEAQELD